MSITLYSYALCPYSHRCRIVFQEKEMEATIKDIQINDKPDELALLNHYNQVPVLIDRELVLYESNVINEYLDERFPHPQLMPSDIKLKARTRLLIYQLDLEIFPNLRTLVLKRSLSKEKSEKLKKQIIEGLIFIAGSFPKNSNFILDKELTMLDIALAPLLWRLDFYDIKLPLKTGAPLYKYAERIFSRQSFIDSMSVAEKSMRK